MATSMVGVINQVMQNARGPSAKFSSSLQYFGSTAAKTCPNKASQINLKNLFSQGRAEKSVSISYSSLMQQRREQARRSVLIQTPVAGSEVDLHQRLHEYGPISKSFHFKDKKNSMLVEFKKQSSVKNVLRNAGHFQATNKIPVELRTLYYRGGSEVTRKKILHMSPLVYEDYMTDDDNSIRRCTTVCEQMVLHQQLRCLSDLGARLRFFICTAIEDMVSGLFPHCNIIPFGSAVNGFGTRSCDLDMMLQMLPPEAEGGERMFKFLTKQVHDSERAYAQKSLGLLADMLQLAMPSCHSVVRILRATVPIIRFKHDSAVIDCDLSFYDQSGAKMSELMYTFGELDSRVRPLVSVLKHWARARTLTKANPGPWITNFMLLALTIHYLQASKVLPSISTMQQLADKSDQFSVDGLQFSFTSNIDKLPKAENNLSLEELLVDFFSFYSRFNFKTYGISLVEGGHFMKPDLSPMYIENPFNIASNVCKNVSKSEMERLKLEIDNALWALSSNNSPKSNGNWGILGLFNGSVDASTRLKVSELYETELA